MPHRIAIALTCTAIVTATVLNGPFPLASANGRAERGQYTQAAGVTGWMLQPKIIWATTRDDPSFTAEIYRMNADGSGLTRLTFNAEEERGPDWSPDGSRILYSCRKGGLGPTGVATFELCVMNADGSNQVRLTFDSVPDLGPNWSLDGAQIVFNRPVSGRAQLFRINADGTGFTQLTNSAGVNVGASQGVVKVAGVPGGDASLERPRGGASAENDPRQQRRVSRLRTSDHWARFHATAAASR